MATNEDAVLKLLHVTPAFFPAAYWGGPIHSLYGLCNALSARPDVELKVLTTDTAGPFLSSRVKFESNPVHYPAGYDVHFSKKVVGVDIAPGMLPRLWNLVGWADVVHLTAVYSFPTIPTLTACRAIGRPLVWSPRGALQRWKGTTRPRAKYLWERVCDGLLKPSHSILHVTSAEEATESRERIRNARVEVLPNGIDLPALPESRAWRPDGVLRLLYVGRLHPKKGLENLLRALAWPQPFSWALRICGAGDASYTQVLKSLAMELGISDRVTFVGHVDGESKRMEFLQADVTVLPSFSENFGMAVAEALAHGVPVVAGKGTPWAALESQAAGLWVDNAPDSLRAAIARLGCLDLEAMGQRGRVWMRDEYAWDGIAERMCQIYERLRQRHGDGRERLQGVR